MKRPIPKQWQPSARNLTIAEIEFFRHEALNQRVEDFPLGSVAWPYIVLSLIQELELREIGR